MFNLNSSYIPTFGLRVHHKQVFLTKNLVLTLTTYTILINSTRLFRIVIFLRNKNNIF